MKSRVRLTVKGLNQERTFNALTREVQVLHLERRDKHTSQIEIAPKDAKKTKKLLRSNNFEILKVENLGLYKWTRWLISAYGLIAACVIVIALYAFQYNFVWQICVFGNEKLATSEIVEEVEAYLPSRFKGNINTKSLEIALKDKYDEISSVSVAIIGQSLVINIGEALLPDEMSAAFTPITSNFDGLITETQLIQGTLAVSVGDIVRAGDVLVWPYIIDSNGNQRPVKALANIKADIWLVGEEKHNSSYLSRERTGNKMEMSEVLLFGLSIYSNSKVINYKEYDVEENIKNLTKNNILPFKIKKRVYYEVETKLIESEFENCKDDIISKARENALLSLKEYEIIKDESYTLTQVGGITTVKYVVTVNREIGG